MEFLKRAILSEGSHTRSKWSNPAQYWFAVIGYAVGFGSIWRFPYLVFTYGGGTFLIPYFFLLFVIGIPFMYLENGIGQISQLGIVKTFERVHKSYRGIGIASLTITFFMAVYYNLLLAYSLVYLYHSFESPLPWSKGPDAEAIWNREYFYDTILEISDSIGTIGGFNNKILIAYLISFLSVYLCIMKGIKTSGKVVYFTVPFPYVLLIALLIRGLMLEGSFEGIKFLFTPDLSKIWEMETWFRAANQILFQMSFATGTMILFGSYNPKNTQISNASNFIPWINAITGILGGCTVYSYMGYMAHHTKISITQLPLAGPELAFIAYPAALTLMPFSNFWAVSFFIFLFFLGIDTQFAFVETLAGHFEDEKIKLFGQDIKLEIIRFLLVLVLFFSGLLLVTRAGFYFLDLFDTYSTVVPFMVCALLETYVFGWVYKIERLSTELKYFTKESIPKYCQFCIKYIDPIILSILTLISFVILVSFFFWYRLADLVQYPYWVAIIGIILMFLPLYNIARELLKNYGNLLILYQYNILVINLKIMKMLLKIILIIIIEIAISR